MRKKKMRRVVDHELLDVTFAVEEDWRKMRYIADRMVEPTVEARQQLKLVEAKYMFLLKEIKNRKISALR